jgi:TolB-like protein/DNA-binding winged helix-turn-helix (wHTH) protein
MATPAQSRVVKFGVFEIDLDVGELRKSGVRLKLVGQPFQVLQLLLEHPQEVVTREELRQRLWPEDTFVDYDLALKRIINRLREVLGDSAESPRFIETIPRRGYRFIATVNGNGVAVPSVGGDLEAAKTAETRWSRLNLRIKWVLGLGAAALLLAVLGFGPRDLWLRFSGKRTVPLIRSIAVLPLQNLSSDRAQEYLSDGMTDALITDLAQVGSLRVISRTSSMQYKQTKKSLPEIAHELNVDGIVEGTVQRSGDRVRITAQLINGPSDKHVWAESYERDLRDVFALEGDIAGDIAHQVRARIETENQVHAARPRPVNLDALQAYLEGNFHLNKGLTGPRDEGLRKAGEYFQHAIDADPTFAPAYIGLAEAHHILWWPSSEDFAIMRASAEKALELAPNSPEAHEEVGTSKYEDWDWAGAEEETRRALALNPNSASEHAYLADSLETRGEMDEALKEYEIAQELDPNQDHLSGALYRRGQYDRAIELARRTAESHPEDAVNHWFISEMYAQKGLYKEWDEELGKVFTLVDLPEAASRLHRAFVTSGYPGALRQEAAEMERLIAQKQGYFPGVLAEVYAKLGDKDRAFYWLGQGIEHRHMPMSDPLLTGIKMEPGFASLRSDPRFPEVLRRMGLPP